MLGRPWLTDINYNHAVFRTAPVNYWYYIKLFKINTLKNLLKLYTWLWRFALDTSLFTFLNSSFLSCTLRSWVHEMFIHSRTVSPRLGDNYASKFSSYNFPHTKYMSPCMKNCQNYIAMYSWSPIPGKRS